MPVPVRRFFKYYYLKLVRQNGSPDFVARGVAIGLFIGFLIPMGGQMIIALLLAYLFKAHKIPAMGCTWVTNQITVFFIYPLQCYLGSFFTGDKLELTFLKKLFSDFLHEVNSFLWNSDVSWWKNSWNGLQHFFQQLLDMGSEVVIPFFIGGFILGVVFAFIGYFSSYGMITHHNMKVDLRIKKKLASQSHRDSD